MLNGDENEPHRPVLKLNEQMGLGEGFIQFKIVCL